MRDPINVWVLTVVTKSPENEERSDVAGVYASFPAARKAIDEIRLTLEAGERLDHCHIKKYKVDGELAHT